MRELSTTCLTAAFEAFTPRFELVSSGEDTEDDGLRHNIRAPPLPIVRWCGVCCTGWGVLLMIATILFVLGRPPSPQAALAAHSVSTPQAPRPTAHTTASGCRMCTWCEEWVHEPTSKFHGMWGIARRTLKLPQEPTCWDRRGGQRFFEAILAGGGCDQEMVEASLVEPTVAPLMTPATALLGFEADILKYCGSIVDADLPDRSIAAEADVDILLASTCARANKNIFQVEREDSSSWDMCQHMEWQMKLLLAAREANRRNPPKPVGNPWFVTPRGQESRE
ncbi:hypothetical protein AB1Y20_017369 [Prymnesium parvum]|uniref:Uncharacterized protein n=1 Tax=Prymnesium parvum TaxID=97485 RepID=A0AB34JL27_PRYPA